MTTEEKIAYIQTISEEEDADVVSAFLSMAEEIAKNRVFPFGYTNETKAEAILDKYQTVICEIAVYLLNKRGAEGQTSHNENSADRTYENGGVPDSIIKKLIPFCGVI